MVSCFFLIVHSIVTRIYDIVLKPCFILQLSVSKVCHSSSLLTSLLSLVLVILLYIGVWCTIASFVLAHLILQNIIFATVKILRITKKKIRKVSYCLVINTIYNKFIFAVQHTRLYKCKGLRASRCAYLSAVK